MEYEGRLKEFERNMPADIANGVALESDRSVVATRIYTAATDRLAVEGELAQAQSFYRRTVGQEPVDLATPETAPRLPASLDELLALAGAAPNIVAAKFYEQAARDYVDSAFSEMLPSISIEGSIARYEELYDDRQASTEGRLLGVVRVPLYEAGATSARVREAKQRVYENRYRVDDERRIAEREASDAWSALRTAESRLAYIDLAIQSARTALTDTMRDYERRYNSGIDLADREVELLYAQLQLVDAQTDRIRAQYRILAAAGNLTARALALNVPFYDPTEHYDKVRNKIWGTGPSLD
jgi:outer membrane protein TolC